jgi:hypothetical protein
LWPPEDQLFLRLVEHKTQVLSEIRHWIGETFLPNTDEPTEVLDDLFRYVAASMTAPTESSQIEEYILYCWCPFI